MIASSIAQQLKPPSTRCFAAAAAEEEDGEGTVGVTPLLPPQGGKRTNRKEAKCRAPRCEVLLTHNPQLTSARSKLVTMNGGMGSVEQSSPKVHHSALTETRSRCERHKACL
eukprot:6472848-Amphidinium_carterae.1